MDKHSELRSLFGRNPWTAVIAVAVVAFQVAVAWALSDASIWLVILVAWLVGAFASHILFVVIHECTHRLVFRSAHANRVVGILANLPMFVPSAMTFERCHLKHHAFQGVYDRDVDLPSYWEIRLFGSSAIGKALWLFFQPVVLALRPLRLKGVPIFDRWVLANWLAVFAFDGIILWYMGPISFLYLVSSLFFAVGLHPLGARWIQEHYTSDDDQETFSYYGWLNRLQLNVGYHNEHHDLPAVPWNRLPEIKRLAPEFYDTLKSYKSWSGLLLDFLASGRLSMSSRVTRDENSARSGPDGKS
jgi:sphingolipid delta-4 desaturase